MQINGAMLIGADESWTDRRFGETGLSDGSGFSSAGPVEAARACALADDALASFSETDPATRAAFLEAVADAIAAIGEPLIERAMAETGLPRARLESERGRTTGQLRLFADIVRGGDWADVTVDAAMPDRQPLPRPDLRRRNVALGPVAVFGASNFPLAFSTAGVDTASAFAAGCPVVVKGHPAHPGTGELVARAVRDAVARAGLHPGVFSFLPGETNELGGALVADPRVKAVGFTGSRAGGLALMRIAAARPEPVPVFAEMSSINPVILFPAALEARAEALGAAFIQSLTMGAGQFCTNPGLILALEGPALERFVAAAAAALAAAPAQRMLSSDIRRIYEGGVDALERHDAVSLVAKGCVGEGQDQASGALFRTDAAGFTGDAALGHEVFGSSSIIVACRDFHEIARVVAGLEGQLTGTLHLDPADEPLAAPFVPLLERKAGRVLANGWPTGVEVVPAMVHGGPFPATSDARTTSVGSLAMQRFLRPVCYQALPDGLLPPAVKAANPWAMPRRVDGAWRRAEEL